MFDDFTIPLSAKLTMIGAAFGAFYALMKRDPMRWFVRLGWGVFVIAVSAFVGSAIASVYPKLPPEVSLPAGTVLGITLLPILDWINFAAKDPLGTAEKILKIVRGQKYE